MIVDLRIYREKDIDQTSNVSSMAQTLPTRQRNGNLHIQAKAAEKFVLLLLLHACCCRNDEYNDNYNDNYDYNYNVVLTGKKVTK